jgi:alpha-D-ribose 1-methylphosphonate 5-triphosphate synthase subunit PhnL
MINAFLNLKQNRTLPLLALLNWSAKLWSCSSKTHAGGHDMECVAGRGMR